MIEIKTENFSTNNTIYSYVFVDGKEVGFIAKDLKAKTFQFFYDDLVNATSDTSPMFANKKEIEAWLNTTFG